VKAGIIAAGEGSRLKEDGVSVPKPLVKVNGTPILERLLKQYHSLGISEAHCIINEQSTSVKDYIEKLALPLPVHFHIKSTESSMHSLFELGTCLKEDHFLLSTVDSIFDSAELSAFLDEAQTLQGDALLAVTPYRGDENPLWVELDSSNGIRSFRRGESGEQIVTGGLYFLSPRIFDAQRVALERGITRLRNFLGLLLEMGYTLRARSFTKIIDLDHAEDIRRAEEFLHALEEPGVPTISLDGT
jgi:NDP-sugar pyrophosphorylase family protein